jgi:hypothetical protein
MKFDYCRPTTGDNTTTTYDNNNKNPTSTENLKFPSAPEFLVERMIPAKKGRTPKIHNAEALDDA